jgi:tetratricopeptide (TPR) repeat protein
MAQPSKFNLPKTMQEAIALHRQGRLREAEKLYARALKAAPDNFDALHMLGLIKAQSGQMGEAYRLMSAALRLHPKAGDAWINLANVLHALKRDAEALECLDKAVALSPADPHALQNRGSALLTLGRTQEALDNFERVLTADPRNGEALFNRGVAKAKLGQHAPALADFDAVLLLAPDNPDTLYNRGTALFELGRDTEALQALERAVRAAPSHINSWINRGRAQQALNRYREAADSFTRAITLQKDSADAHYNRAFTLLALGEMTEGFADYEWRWKRTGMTDTRRNFRGQLWLGEYPLRDKSILLHAEQGLGDTIMFARYAPLLAQGGARVLLQVQPELKSLMSGLNGIASCYARGEELPRYDVHCPLGSLPFALKRDTLGATVPYLRAPERRLAQWRPRVEALPGRRVALCWAGNPNQANDINRSMTARFLEPLLGMDGISFIGIQHDLREGDAEWMTRHPRLSHFGGELTDMADTAALMTLADLTITVDTSVLNLAGAMGLPAWGMLTFSPDWRWMSQGESCPWYPQLKLFRQPSRGDWQDVIARVGAELKRFADA